MNNNPENSLNPELSDFGSGFLKDVDEADREIVAKYLKPWDSQVGERFRERDSEIKKWKELGEYENIQEVLGMVAWMRDNPLEVYDNIIANFADQIAEREKGNKKMPTSDLPEWEGVPQEFVDKFLEMQSNMDTMSKNYNEFQERSQRSEFDNYIARLHTEQGEFDDDWVMTYLARNEKATGLDAVNAFKEMVQSYNTPKEKVIPPAPNVPQGNGSVFSEQVDLKKLSRDEKLDLIARALERAKG